LVLFSEDEEEARTDSRDGKPMEENRLSSISKAASNEKIGEFWGEARLHRVRYGSPGQFEVGSTVPVQLELLNEIEKQAAKRGVKVETLVNQWSQQKIDEEAA
jgi:hypothetical protein